MATRWILLLLSVTMVHAIDPCREATVINEPHRSMKYNGSVELCDRLMSPGWYRFEHAEMLFDTCVRAYHCGTHVPIWVVGQPPSTGDGIVTRQTCGDYRTDGGDCCGFKSDIRVKNCGTYLVYDLKPVPGCSMAYCAGNLMPCADDEYSPTGFVPCVAAWPKLTGSPILSTPLIDQTDFKFSCTIPYDPNNPDAIFDVTWLLDGAAIPGIPSTLVTMHQREVYIYGDQLAGHLNSMLSCSVKTSFLNTHTGGKQSPPSISNGYYIGLKYTEERFTVDQTNPEKTAVLISTIPVVCKTPGVTDCSVDFHISTDNEIITTDACVVKLRPNSWNPATHSSMAIFHVSIKPSLVPEPTSITHITTTSTITGSGNVWTSVGLPSVTVHKGTDKPGAQCTSFGDPHVKTFDSTERYDHFKVGQYTMVKLRHGSFRVDTRTWMCLGAAACHCAVAAREGNDVISIDMCNGHQGTTFPEFKIKNKAMFTNSTEIVQDPSGKNYVIKFPSGASLKVHTSRISLDLTISVPGTFYGETDGLCGYFDGYRYNDLTRSNGYVDMFQKQPNDFIESWKIPDGHSLFEKAETLPVPQQRGQSCTCNGNTGTNDCTAHNTNTKPDITVLCPGCKPVAHPTTPISVTTAMPNIITAAPVVTPVPVATTTFAYPPTVPIFNPVPMPTITKTNATETCNHTLNKFPSARRCIQNEMKLQYADILDTCVADLQLTGDYEMTLSALTTLMEGCGFIHLIHPTNMYNGTVILGPESKVCPGACYGNGDCVDGACVCEHNFEGSECSIDVLSPPTINAISGYVTPSLGRNPSRLHTHFPGEVLEDIAQSLHKQSPYFHWTDIKGSQGHLDFFKTSGIRGNVCDMESEECFQAILVGGNMKNSSQTTCSVTQVHIHMSSTGEATLVRLPLNEHAVDSPAEFHSTNYVTCPIQEPIPHPALTAFVLKLSNNGGTTKSNENEYLIFNSECMACDDDRNCNIKPNTCMIDNRCYNAGDQDMAYFVGLCDPDKNQAGWSQAGTTPHTTTTMGHHDVSFYTATQTGCGCVFDASSNDCACCQNSGCPCEQETHHRCFDCVHSEMCYAK